MWWIDVAKFNINDPTTFGHIKDGKDDMALTYVDIQRSHRIFVTRQAVTKLQAQLTQLKADQGKLGLQLELELSTLRKLETEEKAAEEKRALEKKIQQEIYDARNTWPHFTYYEAEILKVLEEDTVATERVNVVQTMYGAKPVKHKHTLRSAYELVRDRYTLPSLKFFGTPYGYSPTMRFLDFPIVLDRDVKKGDWVSIPLKPANPVPVVDVTKVGTRVELHADGSSTVRRGTVIPRPEGRNKTSVYGEGEYVYVLLDKSSEVWGCYKRTLKAL